MRNAQTWQVRLDGPRKVPLYVRKMRRLISSCACAKDRPGICSPFIDSVVFNDYAGGQPTLIRLCACADWSGPWMFAYARRYIFAWRSPDDTATCKYLTLFILQCQFTLNGNKQQTLSSIIQCSCILEIVVAITWTKTIFKSKLMTHIVVKWSLNCNGQKKKRIATLKTYFRTCSPGKDSDQPAHLRSRISIFVESILDSQKCKVFVMRTNKTDQTVRMYVFYRCGSKDN